MIPNVPGWSAEEIQYLLTLREAPGYENHFGLERQHTIPEMAKKLTEVFGHKANYNPSTLSRMWNLYIVPPGPQKDTTFNERPPALPASRGPQTGFGVQPEQNHQGTAPFNPFDAHSSYGGSYEGLQTYYGRQHGNSNPSPGFKHYGPRQSTYHTIFKERPRPAEQYGGLYSSQGAPYQFSPDSDLDHPAIASYSPMPNQPSYNQGGGFTMIPGMEQRLEPKEADYSNSTIQRPIRNRGVAAGPGNLDQQHQLIQSQGRGRPMRSADLAGGEYDQDWQGGYENLGDLSGGLDVPTAEEVERDLRTIFKYRGA